MSWPYRRSPGNVPPGSRGWRAQERLIDLLTTGGQVELWVMDGVDLAPTPSLLPILRSRQQGEILALLLGDPELELSLTEISQRTDAPHPSVHREVERAARHAGQVGQRPVGEVDVLVLGKPDRISFMRCSPLRSSAWAGL